MGISVFPAAAGGGIKSVQRGSAGGSGTVTITAVNIAKSFVTVFGTASSGSVAASGSVNAANGNLALHEQGQSVGRSGNTAISLNATNISGGSNNLVAAIVQGYLSSSTELVVSGACRWEVVEFA
jgi:hypothetical protein